MRFLLNFIQESIKNLLAAVLFFGVSSEKMYWARLKGEESENSGYALHRALLNNTDFSIKEKKTNSEPIMSWFTEFRDIEDLPNSFEESCLVKKAPLYRSLLRHIPKVIINCFMVLFCKPFFILSSKTNLLKVSSWYKPQLGFKYLKNIYSRLLRTDFQQLVWWKKYSWRITQTNSSEYAAYE